MFKINRFRTMIAVMTLVILSNPLGTIKASAPIVVTASSLQGWLLFNDGTTTPATAGFVNGPGTPPLGTGSYGTAITQPVTKIVFGRVDAAYNNVLLSTLTQLSYSTYVDPTATNKTVNWYINVYLDTTGSGTTYNYRLDFAPPGSTPGVWFTWDTMTQPYWLLYNRSTKTFGAPGTLATVTAGLPANTRIIQGFSTNPAYPSIKFTMGDSGSGHVGFIGNIDNVTIGFSGNSSTTWDFELSLPATNTPTTTSTPTATTTSTVTNTSTVTSTSTATSTSTVTSTSTALNTFTVTSTPTTTNISTALNTLTVTGTPTATNVSTAINTLTPTQSATSTVTTTGTQATATTTLTATQTSLAPTSAATNPTPNIQVADPEVSKSSDKAIAIPGDTVTFTLTVTNNGSAPAFGVVVTDNIASALQIISANAAQGAFTINGNLITFAVGTVNVGQVIRLGIVARVPTSVTPPIDAPNVATLSYTGGNPRTSNIVPLHITGGHLPSTGEHPDAPTPIGWLIGTPLAIIALGGLFALYKRRTA